MLSARLSFNDTRPFMNPFHIHRHLTFPGLLSIWLCCSFFPVNADEAEEIAELKRQIEIVAHRIAILEQEQQYLELIILLIRLQDC